MRSYYETLSKNGFELFLEITQNQSFESALAEEGFNEIIQDWLIFGNEIWTPICRLCKDAESKEYAYTERANHINDDLRLLNARDDY
jgi:hypothetical protein